MFQRVALLPAAAEKELPGDRSGGSFSAAAK